MNQIEQEIRDAMATPNWEIVARLSAETNDAPQEILDRLALAIERKFSGTTTMREAVYPTHLLLARTRELDAVRTFAKDWLYDLAPPQKAKPLTPIESKTRARRIPATPGKTKETVIVVGAIELHLRPAKTTTTYGQPYGSGQRTTVQTASKTQDTWLVANRSGAYLGILQEGSGERPWGVQRFKAGPRREIASSGEEVSSSVRSGATWTEALEDSWWVRQ